MLLIVADGRVRMLNRAMRTSKPTNQQIRAIDVPYTPAVLRRMLPAVTAALSGGPAVLPLPTDPRPVREAMITALRPRTRLEHEGVALVVPTSGSTGEPKGVLLSADAVRASATATHLRLGGPGSWLLALPATHIAGLMVLARSVVAGTEPVALDLSDGFEPELFAAASVRLFAASSGPRYTALVPQQLATILDAGDAALAALTGFDAVLVGGSSAGDRLLDRARTAGVGVVTTYGMTETAGGCLYDGVPLDGVRVEVAEGGLVRLSGPTLASGYRLRPDLTAESFREDWFTTSDVGRFDDDGRLVVIGRVDDVAISGGVNVPLAAVDATVSGHPGVLEALAVAMPDETWGQRIVVAIVPRDSARPPTLESIRAHVARHAPVAYSPKEMVVLDQLPTVPGGKSDRRAVAAQLTGPAQPSTI